MWRDSNFVCFTIDLARVRPREESYVYYNVGFEMCSHSRSFCFDSTSNVLICKSLTYLVPIDMYRMFAVPFSASDTSDSSYALPHLNVLTVIKVYTFLFPNGQQEE
jgi:hypothetical protein